MDGGWLGILVVAEAIFVWWCWWFFWGGCRYLILILGALVLVLVLWLLLEIRVSFSGWDQFNVSGFVHELLICLEESGEVEANSRGHTCRVYLYTR